MQFSVQIKIKPVVCEVGNGISKLCTSQATKNVLLDCSVEPLEAHCDREIANGKNIAIKHAQTCSFKNI